MLKHQFFTQILCTLLICISIYSFGHSEEASAPVNTETTSPATSVSSEASEVAVDSQTAAVTEPVIPLKKQIDTFFGDNIVAPMWSYFLGFPVTENKVLMFVNGEPLVDHQGNPVMDSAKPKFLTDKDGQIVPAKDDDGNLIYDEPKQVLSRQKVVLNQEQQIDMTLLRYAVLANGSPISLESGEHLTLIDKKSADLVFTTLPNGKTDNSIPVSFKGNVLTNASGNPILPPDISFIHCFDEPILCNAQGVPLLSVAGQLILNVHQKEIPLADTTLESVSLPFIVIVLAIGGVFFTLLFAFINIRLFKHAIHCVQGKYDNPADAGEVSHFKALTSALSATVGLGNIAGVAIAIAMGGPGAVFWMWLVAFFGMSLKFSSCSLSQMFRRIKPDGSVLGGPMIYLDDGISGHYPKIAWLGKALALLFCLCCVLGAFGGGNLFQGNQTYSLIAAQCYGDAKAAPAWLAWCTGIILAISSGLVLIGGIKRIGNLTSKMVPLMCATYSALCIVILAMNVSAIPHMFAEIFIQAFKPDALIAGGFLGVFVTGMKRAAFSNEAGLGSAAIAHAAAKTEEPIREGIVALLEPFIDTIIVCSMTALAILVTESHLGQGNGIELTRRAFSSLGTWAPWVLVIIVVIFAYSTIISWSYYAERVLEYMFGPRAILPYRIVYVIAIVFGPIFTLTNVLDFSDLMMLSMAFPNIIGMIILSPILYRKVQDYCARLRSGEMKPYIAEGAKS